MSTNPHKVNGIFSNPRNPLIFLTLPPYRALLTTALIVALCGAATVTAQPQAADSLDLAHCLDTAFSRNRELIQARERIEEAEGSRVVVRSRLMPQLSLTANYDALRTERLGETEDNLASELLFQQRLFEFGPDAASEIQVRGELRQALFDYQDKVYETTSRVWEVYQLILLQDQQIALRDSSRAAFGKILDRQQAAFEKRLASEEEKLQAELNVLEEELQISILRRQQFRNKMELLRLIGRPIGVELQLRGQLTPLVIDQEEAVRVALARDVQIGLREQLLDEQRRVVREIGWEYAPDLAVDAGVEDGRRRAGVSVDRQGETWGVNMETGLALSEEDDPGDDGDATWSANVRARIPIFAGGARIGREGLERARLRRLQVQLRDLRAEVELTVRQAYQNMLEAEEQQRLQEQRVQIARRRYEINQLLQEKGQADEAKLEAVREQFFGAQTQLFRNQETVISRQATLRRLMGTIE